MLHHQTLVTMAKAGVGIMPGIALEGAGRSRCHPLNITSPRITRKIGMVTFWEQALSPTARAMAKAISESFGLRPTLAG